MLVAIAALGVAVADRLRLPAIVGFVVIGALVGPHGLGIVDDPDRATSLAELGVVFLLFEIGLELPVERIRHFFREALVAGGLQVALTLVAGWVVAMALGVSGPGAWVMGALVAMSSTALVMGLLNDRGEIDAPHGQLSLGILLFQDLCIVPFLLAVPLMAATRSSGWTPLAWAVGQALLALGLLFASARLGLPRLLDRAARTRSRELFALLALTVVLGSALAAEFLGLTLAVGAFIGGLALSASPYSHQLFAEVMPLRGILLGVFFTAVGMLVDLGAALDAWDAVALYAIGVIVLKFAVIAFVVAVILRQGARRGVLTGVALAQTGEFSFVLAASALAAGLLASELYQIFLAGSVLTLIATPFLIQLSPRLAIAAGRLARDADPSTQPELPVPEAHGVLIGFGLAGQQVARVLRARGVPTLAVEMNPHSVRTALARGESVIYGDATRRALLERIGLDRARLAVVAVSDPLATREIVGLIRSMAPQLTIIARTRFVQEIDALEAAGATAVVAEEFESTLELVAETLHVFGVPDERITRFTAGLREEGYELMRGPAALILDPWLAELLEQEGTEWVEVPESFAGEASLAALDLRGRTEVNVVAVERAGDTTVNPPAAFALRRGDRLLALGSSEALTRLRVLLEGESGSAPP